MAQAYRTLDNDRRAINWSTSPICLLAIGSGAAALIYEIVWFQYLELVVGSSAVSLGVLLATFMGGTCLGSLLFPRLVSSRFHPLRVYALVEAGIAVLGMLTLVVMPAVGRIYTAWSGYGSGGFLLRGVVAAVCLLPSTLLMGATLPALSRRIDASLSGVSGLGFIYGANIAGAVVGCLLAGFYLLREYDISVATTIAAAINVAVATLAFVLAALRQKTAGEPELMNRDRALDNPETTSIYVSIGLSGLCALAAEVIWTRSLGLLLGASVYTLSVVLSVFLVGLGIGSSVGSLLSRSLARPRVALGYCQLLAAAAIAWSAYSLSASLPYWPINPSISSSSWFTLQLDLDRAFWVLLPATLLWGACFPLALAAARGTAQDAATLMSRIYAANTFGAIAGATGILFVIGWMGSQRAQQFLIAVSTVSGLFLLLQGPRWAGKVVVVVAAIVSGLLVYSVPPLSPLLVAHGRYAATWVGKGEVVYAEEGLNSSVAVSTFPGGVRTFHVAGKIQASNVPRDMRLQRMLGHLTTLTTSSPRSVLVIGCGAGITAGAVSIDPRVERVTIAEIEPLVPEVASAYFSEENFGVLHNEKVQVRIDDGRHYLITGAERFDGITADPLDPWVKGAANLYTKEFFAAVRDHLNPGGVVTVYIQLFETNKDAVRSAVATFFEVFPNGTIWGNTYEGKGHDMVLLGQTEPLRIDLDAIDRRLGSPEFARVAESLRGVGMDSALDLFATYAGRGPDLVQWLREAPINRDQDLRMQYLAGLALNDDDSADIYADMLRFRTFPDTLFHSSEGRVERLRTMLPK